MAGWLRHFQLQPLQLQLQVRCNQLALVEKLDER